MDHEGSDEARAINFRVDVPAEEKGGSYANFLVVWHTGHEFTFDFAATQPPEQDESDSDAPPVVPVHVVARVKIPVSVIFSVLRAINENMTRYEKKFGEISQRQPPEDTV